MASYDIRNVSLPEFVRFIFDHPAAPFASLEERDWYSKSDLNVSYDAMRNAELYIELFSNPKFLLDQFDRHQLEQGFWALQCGNLPGSVYEIIWNARVPLNARTRCVESQYFLFHDLFAVDALHTSSNMWWDCMVTGHAVGDEHTKGTEDEREIQNAIFDVLSRILLLDSEECQGAALHGLGHLHHPGTEAVIMAFIKAHPELSEEDYDYAIDCIEGNIM